MRFNRRTVRAVLASLWVAGTAFFIPVPAVADDSPVTAFFFQPSPYSLTKHVAAPAKFRIGLDNDSDMDLEIRIYTPAGELVSTLLRPNAEADDDTVDVAWPGINDRGELVKPGGYFCKLLATPSTGGDSRYSKTVQIGVLP